MVIPIVGVGRGPAVPAILGASIPSLPTGRKPSEVGCPDTPLSTRKELELLLENVPSPRYDSDGEQRDNPSEGRVRVSCLNADWRMLRAKNVRQQSL
jgi:hypothetical protein